MNTEVKFRFAKRSDIPLILNFIRGLAEYEKMSDEVVADEKTLEELGLNFFFPLIITSSRRNQRWRFHIRAQNTISTTVTSTRNATYFF